MSRAKLNIWLRYVDCRLITDCWRADLVIKTCGGDYLVDMDPMIIGQLKERYSDFARVEINPNYQGATRILLQPGGGRFINHIEVDVPPGCYVVWARICHGRNEETNKMMVIVRCGDEACVNLLLNTVELCAKELFHPFAVQAVQAQLPNDVLQGAIRGLMVVARKPKREIEVELAQRLDELKGAQLPELERAINKVAEIIKGVPECGI
jgi:hypothetical protein